MRKVTVADVRALDTYLAANRVLGCLRRSTSPCGDPAEPDLGGTPSSRARRPSGRRSSPTPANIEARLVRRTLANGIKVLLLPKKTRGGTVIAQLSLYWGDEASKANRARACGFADGMMMRGSLKHTRAELRDAFDKLNSSVSVGASGAAINTRRPQLDDTLLLVAEVLREPAFPASEFEELRRATLTGTESQRGDPSAIAGEPRAPPHPIRAATGTTWRRLRSASPTQGTMLEEARAATPTWSARRAIHRGGGLRPRGADQYRGTVRRLAQPGLRASSRYFEVAPIDGYSGDADKATRCCARA